MLRRYYVFRGNVGDLRVASRINESTLYSPNFTRICRKRNKKVVGFRFTRKEEQICPRDFFPAWPNIRGTSWYTWVDPESTRFILQGLASVFARLRWNTVLVLIPGLGGRGWIRNAEKSGTELVSSQFQPNREAELNLLLSCHVPRGENVKRGDSKGGRRRRPHQRREGRRRRERHATGHVDPPLVPTILSVPVSLYLFTSRVRSACTPPGYPAATIFRKVGEGFEILILNLYFRSIFQFKFVSIPRDWWLNSFLTVQAWHLSS